ncbi:MAG: hypothetical protein AAF791_14355 [Bacteroidota bacterium]
MNRRVPALLATIVLCLLALIYGPERVVLAETPGGIPVGTWFVIVALIAGAAIPLVVSRAGSVLRWAGLSALAAAVLWFPIGAYLAGNPALNFYYEPEESLFFRRVTIGTAGLILSTMVWAAADGAWRWWKRRGANAQAESATPSASAPRRS